MDIKEKMKEYWDYNPCGTKGFNLSNLNVEDSWSMIRKRYKLEPFIHEYAQFSKWQGKEVLEVGCGAGSDLIMFSFNKANIMGIDLSPESAEIARTRLGLHNLSARVMVADAECLPFEDNTFDFVYSWGVLHHTTNTNMAIKEIHRVLKPHGHSCVMLYHKKSLVALQLYLRYGLLSRNTNINQIIFQHHESVGTKAYTITQAREMFGTFKEVKVSIRITPYDLRYWKDKYLPSWACNLIPRRFGWFLIVEVVK